jgi:hypothetical protein
MDVNGKIIRCNRSTIEHFHTFQAIVGGILAKVLRYVPTGKRLPGPTPGDPFSLSGWYECPVIPSWWVALLKAPPIIRTSPSARRLKR